LAAEKISLAGGEALPTDSFKKATPNWICGRDLQRHHSVINRCGTPGFYIGSVTEFHDLVNYWNLRATDTTLLFYDPAFGARLDGLRAEYLAALQAHPKSSDAFYSRVPVWSRREPDQPDIAGLGNDVLRRYVSFATWNGLHVRASVMHFGEKLLLAAAAIQIIRENNSGSSQSWARKFQPEEVLANLAARGVFQVGLKLECPICHLDFWVSLDDVRTRTTCEYCGQDINVTPQRRDRDWRYRRSGLFGRDDHQEGGIPVALTLLQMQTALHSYEMLYATAMEIEPADTAVKKCETDFVILTHERFNGELQIAIGECKNRGEITADDVSKLRMVAEALEKKVISPKRRTTWLAPCSVGAAAPAKITSASRKTSGFFIYSIDHTSPARTVRVAYADR